MNLEYRINESYDRLTANDRGGSESDFTEQGAVCRYEQHGAGGLLPCVQDNPDQAV